MEARTKLMVMALAVATLMILPTVAAQGPPPKLTLENVKGGISDPLVPEVSRPGITVEGTYSIESAPQTLTGNIGSLAIEWNFNCGADDSVVSITGPGTTVHAVENNQQTVEIEANFQVAVTRDAPALKTITCEVTATGSAVNSQGLPAPQQDGKTSFQLSAQYYSLIEASVNRKLGQSGPQKQIPFQIDVSNFSNGQTRVIFGVENEPGGKWQHILPDQLILESPKVSGNTETGSRTFEVATPFKNGWNNEEGAYTITLTPEYSFKTDDSQVGTPIQVNVLARVRGVYVPTLEPMLMLGAVIGSGMLLRMGRDE